MLSLLRKKIKFCRKEASAQATLEFTFAMVCLFFVTLGLIRIFVWVGIDMMKRKRAHREVLTEAVCSDARCPLKQVRPLFFTSSHINAYVASDIYGTNYP